MNAAPKGLFQPFQPFNRWAPFKSLKLAESAPAFRYGNSFQ
jgi:hypothetical protein